MSFNIQSGQQWQRQVEHINVILEDIFGDEKEELEELIEEVELNDSSIFEHVIKAPEVKHEKDYEINQNDFGDVSDTELETFIPKFKKEELKEFEEFVMNDSIIIENVFEA